MRHASRRLKVSQMGVSRKFFLENATNRFIAKGGKTMADVIPSYIELKKATQEIKKHIQQSKSKRYISLDLFYAVECGLKALLLQENKHFREEYKTHDLNQLARKCKFKLEIPNKINTPNNPIKSFGVSKIHEVLRYGVYVKQKELEDFNNKISLAYEKILTELSRI